MAIKTSREQLLCCPLPQLTSDLRRVCPIYVR